MLGDSDTPHPPKRSLLKTMWENEKKHFSPFPMFSLFSLPSADVWNLEESRICCVVWKRAKKNWIFLNLLGQLSIDYNQYFSPFSTMFSILLKTVMFK